MAHVPIAPGRAQSRIGARRHLRLLPVLLLGLLLCSCGSATREFLVRVIDESEQEIPSLIVVNGEWPVTPEEATFFTPGSWAKVRVEFQNGRADLDVKSLMQPATGDDAFKHPNGIEVRDPLPTPGSPSLHRGLPPREILPTDPKKMLFVLRRRN